MFLVTVVGVKRHNLLKPRMLIYIFCTSSHILGQTTEFNVLFLSEENCWPKPILAISRYFVSFSPKTYPLFLRSWYQYTTSKQMLDKSILACYRPQRFTHQYWSKEWRLGKKCHSLRYTVIRAQVRAVIVWKCTCVPRVIGFGWFGSIRVPG